MWILIEWLRVTSWTRAQETRMFLLSCSPSKDNSQATGAELCFWPQVQGVSGLNLCSLSTLRYCVHLSLLQFSVKVIVAQSCPSLCDPMDYSPLESSVYRIFQARILEQFAISYSRRSSQLRDWACVPCSVWIGRWILYQCITREALLLL